MDGPEQNDVGAIKAEIYGLWEIGYLHVLPCMNDEMEQELRNVHNKLCIAYDKLRAAKLRLHLLKP